MRHAKNLNTIKMKQLIQFLDITLTGLIAGVIFGIWIGNNPQDLSAVTYVEQQQNTIRALNVLMPILGLISIILTGIYAVLSKGEKLNRNLLLLATAFLIISGLITRFGNQPINAIVITWKLENIPDIWSTLRDKWWSFHIMRTLSAMTGFALIVYVSIFNKIKGRNV
ncbi:protein of unknown function [Maribacter sedimenticola]|uniref:DUF1772 domain-containing protein n=2 Tax=Maribacter sedimenticola TaxID=228956 RepID=A0ABY1SHM0_9FLAO|nr:protein of unknown function [Maribacter sedimenticola]